MGLRVRINSVKPIIGKIRNVSVPHGIKPAQAEESIGEMLGNSHVAKGERFLEPHFNPGALKLQELSQKFSTIFRQDISAEESEKMLQQYKKLLKIKDRDTFIQKAFKQVKKDYGYADKDIKLTFNKQDNGSASYIPQLCIVNINSKSIEVLYNTKSLNINQKIDILESFVHEFQHAKQAEYAFRADPERFLEYIFSNKEAYENTIKWLENPKTRQIIKNMLHGNNKFHFKSGEESEEFLNNALKKLKDGNYESDKSVKNLLDMLQADQRCCIQKIFGKFERFEPNSENYNLGIKYLENEENYISFGPKTKRKYRAQLIEAEAYSAEKVFSKILTKSLTPKERLQIKSKKIKTKITKIKDFIHSLFVHETINIHSPNPVIQNS